MEGTSGAAYRDSLRGEQREAALTVGQTQVCFAGESAKRVLRRRFERCGFPNPHRDGLATGGARADRVGAKLRSRAIVAGDAGRRIFSGPWPVKPRLAALRKTRGYPSARWRSQGRLRAKLCTRATARMVSGVPTIWWSCSRIVTIADLDRRRAARRATRRKPLAPGLAPPRESVGS